MRPGLLLVVLGLASSGCPLPDERFAVEGSVNHFGRQGDLEVRLLRNQVASRVDCDRLEVLATTRTDALGHFRFEVLRQQATLGVAERRYFRVEVDGDSDDVLSHTFWFPDGDLDLGLLAVPEGGLTFTEARLDGVIAWRGRAPANFDRASEQRTVSATRSWHEVPLDSLGRKDYVPVETRWETPWRERGAFGGVPKSRNATCPLLDVTPCPLTDGRYVPVELPPDTRTLVLEFPTDDRVRTVTLYGVLAERAPVKLRLEWSPLPDFSWNPYGTPELNPTEFDVAREACLNPGAFVSVNNVASTFGAPRQLRLGLMDAEGALIPMLRVAEVVAD